LGVLGLVFPSIDLSDLNKAEFDTGDTAWLLTSSALVLIMTPGLAFFMAVWLARRM
jgi:Amt family ammonium transporter